MSWAEAELGGTESVSIKQRLRAWLIDLIREAVRAELIARDSQIVQFSDYQWKSVASITSATAQKHAQEAIVNEGLKPALFVGDSVSVSFEQFQAEALRAQEDSDGKEA